MHRLHNFAAAFLLPVFASTADGAEPPPPEWGKVWTVFAPLARGHMEPDPAALAAIPERLEIPDFQPGRQLHLEPTRLEANPGMPVDLAGILGPKVETTAYVFIPVNSGAEQDTVLGLGADHWLKAWLNGELIFDTGPGGSNRHPVSVVNHKVPASLRAGENVLALKFSRGSAGAQLAVGDRSHFPDAQERIAATRAADSLNTLPPTLAERMVLPPHEQAFATAARQIDLSPPPEDFAAGGMAGLREMPMRQVYLDAAPGTRPAVRDSLGRQFDQPVTILLSKSRYPAEDGHLDAIVWTTPPAGIGEQGWLEVILRDAAEEVVSTRSIDSVAPAGWFFSTGLPGRLAGGPASLEVIWRQDETEIGRARAEFKVAPRTGVATSGRIPIRVINGPGATLASAPMTVGVPFPHGALTNENHVRLLDEQGREIPLQTRVTGRWARFGPIKWLLCDFTIDLRGEPRELALEFGDAIQRKELPPMRVRTRAESFPLLDAGRLRTSRNGLEFHPRGGGWFFRRVLDAGALRGAFVEKEDGSRFEVPVSVHHEVEEAGSEKVVIRRAGWFVNPATGAEFCNFVTRFVFHRQSPVLRIFHTWIFTGDGNRDRIRAMGWQFSAAGNLQPEGFLESWSNRDWLTGGSLVQFDHDRFAIDGGTQVAGRAPGVLAAQAGSTRIGFGAKDFWQNFPSELESQPRAFVFYNWPRHNPPASFERPVPAGKAFLSRFAHEGELLDFRLPAEYAADPIWGDATGNGTGGEVHFAKDQPETVNAQGIARTEEMFLVFGDSKSLPREEIARVLEGLNSETLRAVVDPQWIAASGVFGAIAALDEERFPADEYYFRQVALAPPRWADRLGFYGMWLHGDYPAWGFNLEEGTATSYRALRKNHHGWPYSWLPFARSGDPELLKPAEAATRQMLDANFCHFADEAVEQATGPEYFRRQGWWDRSLLPWAGRKGPHARTYTVDCDYIWDAYHLTGYARARDVALLFAEITKQDHAIATGPRQTSSMLPSYLDMYQATWDPWFLLAAHELAALHRAIYPHAEELEVLTNAPHTDYSDYWRPSDEAFYRFTGHPEHRQLALNHAVAYSSPFTHGFQHRWDFMSFPFFRQAAFAHQQTGNPFYLARLRGFLDMQLRNVFDGEPEHARGWPAPQGATIFAGYYLKNFPFALGELAAAGNIPPAVPNPFHLRAQPTLDAERQTLRFQLPAVMVRKQGNRPLPVHLAHRFSVVNPAISYACKIYRPDGGLLTDGSWPLDRQPHAIEIPADAPDGDYRILLGAEIALPEDPERQNSMLRWHGAVRFPLTAPDVPEVLIVQSGEMATPLLSATPEGAIWFRVPEQVGEFWVEFGSSSRYARATVWNPAGEMAWDASVFESRPGRISIPVPQNFRGQIWGISGPAVALDPQIPPIFAVDPQKWFEPRE